MRRGAVLLGVVGLLILTGCPADSGDDPAPAAAQLHVRATLIQYRAHANSREIAVHLTSHEPEPFRVVGVRLLSAGFEVLPPTRTDATYVPGQTIDLATEYGRPVCAQELDSDARPLSVELVIRSQNATTTETVPVADGGAAVLGRLVGDECDLVSLSRTVEVDYVGGFRRTVAADGRLVLRGTLRFARPQRAIPGRTVTVPALDGSVLLIFRPVDGREPGRPLVRLGPTRRVALLPVEMTGTGRCSGHELGESKQTFFLSAFVRRGREPLLRVIVKPPRSVQLRGLELISDICGTPPPG